MANGEWIKGRVSALRVWLMAGLRPAYVAVARVRGCTIILLLETAERVGDKVCSDRVRRAEARLFR
jgi:hypothetical protein